MKKSTLILFCGFIALTGILHSCSKEDLEDFSGASGTFKDVRDNKEYKWLRIGNQVWMAENLAYLPSVSPSSERSHTDLYYYVYGYEGTTVSDAKDTSNYQTYGVLYNLPAALNACPSGWHLPTDTEWKTLEMHLGMSQEEADNSGWRGTDEGGKLKETGTKHWNSPNTGATDESGFTALPGGMRAYSGGFYGIGNYGCWWCAPEVDAVYAAWNRIMTSNNSDVNRANDYAEASGYSVRCLRD